MMEEKDCLLTGRLIVSMASLIIVGFVGVVEVFRGYLRRYMHLTKV
jgi:hypothetical protein